MKNKNKDANKQINGRRFFIKTVEKYKAKQDRDIDNEKRSNFSWNYIIKKFYNLVIQFFLKILVLPLEKNGGLGKQKYHDTERKVLEWI